MAGAPTGNTGRTVGAEYDAAAAAVGDGATDTATVGDGAEAGSPASPNKSSPLSLAGVSWGIRTDAPHLGHFPRFPARNAFTFILCPLGQRNLMPIARVGRREAPAGRRTYS